MLTWKKFSIVSSNMQIIPTHPQRFWKQLLLYQMEKCQQIYSVNQLSNINISHYKLIPDIAAKTSPTARFSQWNVFVQKRRKPRPVLMNCGIIIKRCDTAMKTSKGVSVKPTWFLKNHPWHTNQAKLNKRVPFVLIYHPVFEVAEAIHEHWSVIVMQNTPRNTGCGLQKTRLVTAEISTSKPGIGQCKRCGDAAWLAKTFKQIYIKICVSRCWYHRHRLVTSKFFFTREIGWIFTITSV